MGSTLQQKVNNGEGLSNAFEKLENTHHPKLRLFVWKTQILISIFSSFFTDSRDLLSVELVME